jgi:hypothetical protein
MDSERSENRNAYWRGEQFVMRSNRSGGKVRALFSRGAELCPAFRHTASIYYVRYAVMLPVPTAACGQARRCSRTQREQRRDDREAKESQQQDGK